METDNQNKWNNLRSNLDRLTEIPGEQKFDTEAAWNKLGGRLEKKPIHRKPVFYWAAAASLFIMVSVALYESNNRGEKKLVNNSTDNGLPNTTVHPDSELVNLNAQAARQPSTPIEKPITRQAKQKKIVQASRKSPSIPVDSALTVVTIQPGLNSADSSVLAVSVVADSPALVKTKPVKLRVIHNNQLNSVIYKPELSVSNAPTTFPSSSGNLRFSRNASDNIIQIKLSLTN